MNSERKPFFFYKNLTDIENIKFISNNFDIDDGYVDDKNFKLDGKIVRFKIENMFVIQKIAQLKKCHLGKKRYRMDSIQAINSKNETVDCFIIH